MAREKLPEGKKKILCNYYLPPLCNERIKEIAHRRSVKKGKKVSEATIVEIAIRGIPMPPKPTPEKVAEYEKAQAEKKATRAKGGK